jgi:hypothetical protein
LANLIKVDVDAKESGGLDKIKRDAKDAGREVATGLQDGFDKAEKSAQRSGKQISTSIERGADGSVKAWDAASRKIGEDLDSVGDNARKAGQEAGEGLGDQLAGGLESGRAALASTGLLLGGAVGAAVWSGVDKVFQEREIGGLIAAQNAGTASQAKGLGDIAGDAFADGFGASIEDVSAGLSAVIGQGLTNIDAPRAEIEKLTKLAVTASAVVGDEANNIAHAAQQLLVNGLAGNAEEAIDIIVAAAQNGVNASGDLIDTIVEYGVQFKGLGLDGEQAMGLISQAMKAGARDSDFAADALKEFLILAKETGRPDTIAGFRAIGLDANKMGTEIAAGGDRARAALDLTLDRLRAMPDPVARNAAAVQLFGTKAEDLGASLYAMDLDTVSDQMGRVSGATERAGEAMSAAQSPIDKLGRGLMNLANEGLAPVVDSFEYLINRISGKEPATGFYRDMQLAFGTRSRELSGGMRGLADASADAADKTSIFGEEISETDTAVAGFVQSLDELISKEQEYQSGVIDLHDAQIAFHEALAAGRERIKDNEDGLNLATEAGQKNQKTLDDIAEKTLDMAAAMEQQDRSQTDVTKHMELGRAEFIRTAIQLGANAKQANRMADELRLIPRNVRTQTSVNTGTAMAKARELKNYLDAVERDRYLTVHVGAAGAGLNLGGSFFGTRASGGPASAAELGAVYSSGVGHAAAGGAQGATFWAHEQGPELIKQPNGSVVVPAGLSEMLMSGFAGGQSGPAQIALVFDGNADGLFAAMLGKAFRQKLVRLEVRNKDGSRSEVLVA